MPHTLHAAPTAPESGLLEAADDYEILDRLAAADPTEAMPGLYSNLDWEGCRAWGRPIRSVLPHRVLTATAAVLRRGGLGVLAGCVAMVSDVLQAIGLLWASRRTDSVCLLFWGESRAPLMFCLLRALVWRTRGRVVGFDLFLSPLPWWKRRLYQIALRTTDVTVVWSRRQVHTFRRELGLYDHLFLFVPYKSNHSQAPAEPAAQGDYVFSGGNSKRDYRTLFAAVDGLDVLVIVSTTDPALTRGLNVPSNVAIVRAVEPHFRRLMAGSRLNVVCIEPGVIRSAGEASFLNAMWHGTPVVVADDLAASDYIDNGVTGVVVPAGDVARLRAAIVALWQDPSRCRAMGSAARSAAAAFTHDKWKRRLFTVAWLVFARGAGAAGAPTELT